MTRILIIGGRLQGTEAAYLAKKAGFHSILIDKDPAAPASGIADRTVVLDASVESGALASELHKADVILPATENIAVLSLLSGLASRHGLPLAFSLDAYGITSSKRRSDALIHELALPAPRYDPPEGPYVVKPSGASGSAGVRRCETLAEAQGWARALGGEAVIQEYLEGPSYSLEVIGRPGQYRVFALTEVHVGGDHDCCLVTTPCDVPAGALARFREGALLLAERVGLYGIMDAEAILHEGEMKLLEIDARLPSQTPAAVLASTGVNMVSELCALVQGQEAIGRHGAGPQGGGGEARFASYENIVAGGPGGVRAAGEHVMADAGPLRLEAGFCGADEAMTDAHAPAGAGGGGFRGIFINAADSAEALLEKREEMHRRLEEYVRR